MERPNLSEINKLSNGDKTFEERIFAIIKKEFPLEKDQYFNNLDKKNLVKAVMTLPPIMKTI